MPFSKYVDTKNAGMMHHIGLVPNGFSTFRS
jgi:hypothetical protein